MSLNTFANGGLMFEKRLLSSKILYAHKIFSREIYQVTPGNEPKAVAVAEDVSVDLSEWMPFQFVSP